MKLSQPPDHETRVIPVLTSTVIPVTPVIPALGKSTDTAAERDLPDVVEVVSAVRRTRRKNGKF